MSKQAGKGDKSRNCFSKQFKDNYDNIDWKSKQPSKDISVRRKKDK